MDRIRTLGVTCNSTWNTWRAKRNEANSKRLDYIFVNRQRCEVTDSRVCFTELVPNLNCSYSDHFGVTTHVRLYDYQQAHSSNLSAATFDDISGIAKRYRQREMRQSKLRIWHFIISILIFLAVLVGQWWIKPAFGHFIVLFCTVLIMCFGVVDGLIGFLFMRWEIRAVNEFVGEMALARQVYS